jgi:flagellar hook-basal body complex protein FliE
LTVIEALRLPSVATGSTTIWSETSTVGNSIVSFASQLADVVRAGEQAAISGVRGDMPLQQVVETVLQAERTLTTAISVRDKAVSAYLEMTRMQI